jgi:hypothetical protein
LSDRELAVLLAEAKAMKELYGITLKDACHRLYLAETSKLEAIDAAEKTLAAIRERIDKSMDYEIRIPIDEIDKGTFDDHTFPYGWGISQKDHPVDEVAAGL